MTRVIDVSLPVGPNLLVWPGDPDVEIARRASLAAGDHANVSEIRMGTHTGTHIDAPVHFIEDAAGIDAVPVETLVGPAVVEDLRDWSKPIGPEELDRLGVPAGTERLLLRTASSELWRRLPVAFPDAYAHLTPEGAAWIVERRIRLVGVDFLSIERKGAEGHPVHVALLSNDVVIVEGLDLGDVEPGPYTLAALPLRIAGGDGAPARVVLIED